MHMDAHSLTLGIATLIVGALMAVSGLEKNALEWKRRRRVCPACGRTLVHGRTWTYALRGKKLVPPPRILHLVSSRDQTAKRLSWG